MQMLQMLQMLPSVFPSVNVEKSTSQQFGFRPLMKEEALRWETNHLLLLYLLLYL